MYDDEKLLDHEYDGIRELDNDLPRWWLYLFYITIVWGVIYLAYYHIFGIGYSSADEYKKEMNPAYVRLDAKDSKLFGVFSQYRSPFYDPADKKGGQPGGNQPLYVEQTADSDTTQYELMSDDRSLQNGLALFTKNCVQCHGKLGEGGIGPNLTDNYWIHGYDISGIVKSIKYGYPAKGMVAWRGTLKPDQILEVASYVHTLIGTNPPNAKGPQGNPVNE